MNKCYKIISFVLAAFFVIFAAVGCNDKNKNQPDDEQKKIAAMINDGIDKLYHCGSFIMDMSEDYNGNVRTGTAKFIGMNVDVKEGSLEDFDGKTEESYVSLFNGIEITTLGSFCDGEYHYFQEYADRKDTLTEKYSDGIYSLSEGMSKFAYAAYKLILAGEKAEMKTGENKITTVTLYIPSDVLQMTTYANGDADLNVRIEFDENGYITSLDATMKGTVISVNTSYEFSSFGEEFTVNTDIWKS